MKKTIVDFKCYIPSDDSFWPWGFKVLATGCSTVPAQYASYPLSQHPPGYQFAWEKGRTFRDHYAIVYITRGGGLFESEISGQLNVQSGSVLLLFPDVWHRYRPFRATGWDESWLVLEGDMMRLLVDSGVFTPRKPILNVGVNEELGNQFQLVNRLAELQPVGFQELLSARAALILATIRSLLQRHEVGDTRLERIIREARLMMVAHFDQPLDMPQIAKDLRLSYPHFRRLFKRYTGLAPNQYQLQLRLGRAKDLLRNTQLPVKQIGTLLGFDDPYYFSRIFKAKTGISPQHWRKSINLPPKTRARSNNPSV